MVVDTTLDVIMGYVTLGAIALTLLGGAITLGLNRSLRWYWKLAIAAAFVTASLVAWFAMQPLGPHEPTQIDFSVEKFIENEPAYWDRPSLWVSGPVFLATLGLSLGAAGWLWYEVESVINRHVGIRRTAWVGKLARGVVKTLAALPVLVMALAMTYLFTALGSVLIGA